MIRILSEDGETAIVADQIAVIDIDKTIEHRLRIYLKNVDAPLNLRFKDEESAWYTFNWLVLVLEE